MHQKLESESVISRSQSRDSPSPASAGRLSHTGAGTGVEENVFFDGDESHRTGFGGASKRVAFRRRAECEAQLCGASHLSPALSDGTAASLRAPEKLVFNLVTCCGKISFQLRPDVVSTLPAVALSISFSIFPLKTLVNVTLNRVGSDQCQIPFTFYAKINEITHWLMETRLSFDAQSVTL